MNYTNNRALYTVIAAILRAIGPATWPSQLRWLGPIGPMAKWEYAMITAMDHTRAQTGPTFHYGPTCVRGIAPYLELITARPVLVGIIPARAVLVAPGAMHGSLAVVPIRSCEY